MSYKRTLINALLLGFFSTSVALADSTATPVDLSECKKLAQMTPLDIFSKTQNGVNQTYQKMATQCFKTNACASLTDVDQPQCARSLALNSYLIDVAYRTHGPAYPPFSIEIMNIPTPAKPVSEPVYDNLASPSIQLDDRQKTNSTEDTDTINWS
jgi:hypothetical protein